MGKFSIPYFTGTNLKLRKRVACGATVAVGDVLCTIESNVIGLGQVDMDLEAEEAGVVEWLVEDNASVNFGEQIANLNH